MLILFSLVLVAFAVLYYFFTYSNMSTYLRDQYPEIWKKITFMGMVNSVSTFIFVTNGYALDIEDKKLEKLKRANLIGTIVLFLTFFALVSILFFTTYPFNPKEFPERIAYSMLLRVKNEDFSSASKCFHLPAEMTDDDKESEYKSIENWFNIVNIHLGNISRSDRYNEEVNDVYHIMVAGGDIPYWSNFSGKVRSIVFKGSFEKAGKGYLKVEICKAEKKEEWEVKTLIISLPISSENEERLKMIMRDLNKSTEKVKEEVTT